MEKEDKVKCIIDAVTFKMLCLTSITGREMCSFKAYSIAQFQNGTRWVPLPSYILSFGTGYSFQCGES